MYQMIKGTYCLDGKTYDSFGIQCDEITICDISLNRESIEALVAVCNCETLSPIHLPEIVENYLAAPDIVDANDRFSYSVNRVSTSKLAYSSSLALHDILIPPMLDPA